MSTVRRALNCRAGGRWFDPWGRTNTQGLKITEKPIKALSLLWKRLDLVRMARMTT